MTPEGRFADLNELPTYAQYYVAGNSLNKSQRLDDPEDTLMVQLTFPEVSAVTLALVFLSRICPEFEPLAADLSTKLREVANAQEFLTRERNPPDE